MHRDRNSPSEKLHTSRNSRKLLAMSALAILVAPFMVMIAPAQAAISPTIKLNESEFQFFVSPAAPNIPADSGSYYVLIQLQTAHDDKPLEAPVDLDLRLVSSDPSVIIIPQERMIFEAGESMLKAEVKSTAKAGLASITALAEGVAPHTATITTLRMDSLEPTKLAIYAAPSSFIPDPKLTGLVYLQLLNSQNLPAKSNFDTAVDMSSSEPTIGNVPSYAVIPAGSSGLQVKFTPQKNIGETTLKASALGLVPAELKVKVVGPVAERILVEFAPDILPAVNFNTAMMSVQLVDEDDLPVKVSENVRITLRSSDTAVAEVPQYIDILSGHSYATAFVKSKGTLGSVTITATATGYETGLNTIQAVSLSTASLQDAKVMKVFSLPSTLPPDNSEHESIVVAFQDESGNPYRQSSYIYSRIVLSTSNTQVGEITSASLVGRETYAIGKFTTKYAVGDTILTASAQGYQPGQMELVVDGSGPAAVTLTQIPGIIEAKNTGSDSLVVGLLGHNGEPVAAQEDTTVYLSSSNTDIAKVQASVLIHAGESHAVTEVQSTQKAGQAIVSGAADGLGSGSVAYKTVGFSGSISEYHLGVYVIPKLPADGREYEAITVQLQDQNGLPVLAKADTEVSLSAGSFTGGRVQEKVMITAGLNLASATYKTSLVEDSSFKVTASAQGYTSVEQDLETTTQPLTLIKSSTYPSKANFGDEVIVGVDVFTGAVPVRGAEVTITGTYATDNVVITDENGHAEGRYIPTLPGSNSITVKVSKPGYEQKFVTSRIILDQTINLIVDAQTQGAREIVAPIKIASVGLSKSLTSKPGAPITLMNSRWGTYTLSAQDEIKSADAIYNFAGWSDGSTQNPRTMTIVNNTEIKAIYKAKYLLQVTDPNGFAQGGGYFDEGSSAVVSMKQTEIGGLLVDKKFDGWSGDIASSIASTEITMDGPKSVNAVWSDSYLKVILIIAAAAGGGFFYYWKIFKPKKAMEQKQRAPDLDWYKT